MNESVVDVSWPPTCPPDCHCHALYRSGFHVASDLVDAWHTVAARPDVDVGDPAERHIAGARLGRAMFVRLGSPLGHRSPTSVVSCAVSVTADGDERPAFEAVDHLLLVTDRAIIDLGLAARCRSVVTFPSRIIIERLGEWPAGPESQDTLRLRGFDVTVLYRPNDDVSYRRSSLWRRTNRQWESVLDRLDLECMQLLRDSGPYYARSDHSDEYPVAQPASPVS
jgi:hypothetical protein